MSWIDISKANIEGWKDKITLQNIETKTKKQTRLICRVDVKNFPLKKLWYSESRQYLIDKGVKPLSKDAEEGSDVCDYHKLFWNENIFDAQGTIEPCLISTKSCDYNIEITLWCINRVRDMMFRGCALSKNRKYWSKYITRVKPVYKGIILKCDYYIFINGIKVPEPDKYKLETIPNASFFEKQVIDQNMSKWNMHDCSLCDYKCGFVFKLKGDKVKVYYDSGCHCSRSSLRLDTFDNVIKHIEIQSNEKIITEYAKYWNITSKIVII